MNLQAIFDKAIGGVIRQGRLAKLFGGSCAYLGEFDGMACRCGIGQLIDPEFYDERFENVPVQHIWYLSTCEREESKLLYRALQSSGVPVDDQVTNELMHAIQKTHDGASSMRDFINRAASTAQRFNLVFNLKTLQKEPA